jgi:N-acyl-phosphatidylethanolamine-hydrolysing phospholipase D
VARRKLYKNHDPDQVRGLWDVLRWKLGFVPAEVSPLAPDAPAYVPRSVAPDLGKLFAPDPERLQLTWIGHSTFLIQLQGRTVLTDPIFGNCGPLPLSWLRRKVPPAIAFESLPTVQDVLISHNHYDHLDAAAIQGLGNGPNYWLPSGLAGWFARRGIDHCRQMAWWESAELAPGLEIHCVPARHFSARTPFDRNRTHWCGWILRSRNRTIYFAGDTGYCPVFKEIGQRFGRLDLAIIPIGAYWPRWMMQSIHADPDEAVQIHLDLGATQSVASHWGTFALADEPADEPPRLLAQALKARQIPPAQFRALDFGETIQV